VIRGTLIFASPHRRDPLALVFAPDGNLLTANGDAVSSDPTRALPATPAHEGKGLKLHAVAARIIYTPRGDWPEMLCAENPRYFRDRKLRYRPPTNLIF
jgi:hypothetical protein